MKLFPKDEIIQFELPLKCKAFNEHLKIDQVITAKVATEMLEERHINIVSFPMSSIGTTNEYQINSKATEEVINDLLNESKNMGLLAKGINLKNKYVTNNAMIGFGIGVIFITVVGICIYFGLRCWRSKVKNASKLGKIINAI